jgi:hypothetical protein
MIIFNVERIRSSFLVARKLDLLLDTGAIERKLDHEWNY